MPRALDPSLSFDAMQKRESIANRDYSQFVTPKPSSVDSFRASSKPFIHEGKIDHATHENASEPWKDQAWLYYEGGSLPEVASIIDTTAKSVASCHLRPGYVNQDGVTVQHDDEEIALLLRQLHGPSGTYKDIMHWMAVNFQVTGDGYLIAEPEYVVDANGSRISGYRNWEFVSIDEIKVAPTKTTDKVIVSRNATGGVTKFNFSSMQPLTSTELSKDWYIQRGFRRSGRYSQLSDCALKKNLGICRLLVKLTEVINAIADSQVPAGILLVPEELSLDHYHEMLNAGDDAEDVLDSLTEDLIEYVSAATEDHSSPAAVAPLIMRGKSEFLEKVQLVRLGRDLDSVLQQIRMELLDRLATGLDAPRELMQGRSNANHWSAASIDSAFAMQHVEPLGGLIANFLTEAYLWPMLRKRIKENKSSKTMDDVERFRFIFDSSNITSRIDKASQAKHLYDKRVLSEKALLEYTGFELKDARTADERLQDVIFELIKAAPKTLAPILAHRIKGLEDINIELQALEDEAKRRDQTPDADPSTPGVRGPGKKESINRPTEVKIKTDDTKKTPAKVDGPRREPTSEPQEGQPESDKLSEQDLEILKTKVTAFGATARQSALEGLGAKIKQASQKDKGVSRVIQNIPDSEVPGSLSDTLWLELGFNRNSMFTEAFIDSVEPLTTLVANELSKKIHEADVEALAPKISSKYLAALADFTNATASDMSGFIFSNGFNVPDELFDTTVSRDLVWWSE